MSKRISKIKLDQRSISMVQRQNRGKDMLVGPTYEKQAARDLVYAIGMMVIGIVLVGLILL
jgi:preprotein translocase subunit SecF